MSADDISRYLFNRRMRYRTALMQQGRVLTDSDWNEMVALEGENARQVVSETICTAGSPNDGFLVAFTPPRANPPPFHTPAAVTEFDAAAANPVVASNNAFDLSIGAGSIYVSGYRFTLDPPLAGGQAETFLRQADWLTQTLVDGRLANSNNSAKIPKVPAASRTDVVIFRGWPTPVTSIEDEEFRERALGGPDTTVRLRHMRRVEVLENAQLARLGRAPQTCAEARETMWQEITKPWPGDTSGVSHTMDATGTELQSKARLTITFTQGAVDNDPCKPQSLRGYVGAENHAIRLQLTDANHLVWGIDNAAPLYRVKLHATANGLTEIEFLTLPRDQASMPLAGETVELLPWDARLDNGEYAAAEAGFVSAITTSYSPATRRLQIANPVPASWPLWLTSVEPAVGAGYFYLRVWSGTVTQFAPNTPVPLGTTGLEATLNNFGIPGDYWVAAARPNTPDRIVPWDLLRSAPPTGPRRCFSLLGYIPWTIAGGVVTDDRPVDCRERFRSLCRTQGCCTIIVGNGQDSHGDVTSIQAAIDRLPPEGGEVCLLRGEYHEKVDIPALSTNITIHGCGPASRIVVPAGSEAGIKVTDSNNIRIRDLAIHATDAVGIKMRACANVKLQNLELRVRDAGAIVADEAENLEIVGNDIAATPFPAQLAQPTTAGLAPLVFVRGAVMRVERNWIVQLPGANNDPRTMSLGGLQIGGGSRDVEIRRNRIQRGNGNGITLGSVVYVTQAVANDDAAIATAVYPGYWVSGWEFDLSWCLFVPIDPQPTDPGGGVLVPVSQGDLEEIRIVENRIEHMGQCGIAPALLVFPNDSDTIDVRWLTIDRNEILGCMMLQLGTIPPELIDRVAYGGIVLAGTEDASIVGNRIEGIGFAIPDPVCGIYVQFARGIAIRGNRVCDLGAFGGETGPVRFGRRGGVLIDLAMPPDEADGEIKYARATGKPAVAMSDNIVIAREGRALLINATGPVSVTANQLSAFGSDFLGLLEAVFGGANAVGNQPMGQQANLNAVLDAIGGSVVLIMNQGRTREFNQLNKAASDSSREAFIGGNVLFSDNQVRYDALGNEVSFTICAVLVASMDSVNLSDNMVRCDLVKDMVLAGTVAIGFAGVEATGNRFQEGEGEVRFSAATIGVMNTTLGNVATHCILDVGLVMPNARLVPDPAVAPATTRVDLHLNSVLTDPTGTDDHCRRVTAQAPRVVGDYQMTTMDSIR